MSINFANLFDGYTCKDSNEKLYMVDDSSYLAINFTTNSTISSYTIEFWVRPTQNIAGSPHFFAL